MMPIRRVLFDISRCNICNSRLGFSHGPAVSVRRRFAKGAASRALALPEYGPRGALVRREASTRSAILLGQHVGRTERIFGTLLLGVEHNDRYGHIGGWRARDEGAPVTV